MKPIVSTSRAKSSSFSAGSDGLAPALAWVAEHLADELTRSRQPDVAEDEEEPRRDAASFPPDYWRWRKLWQVRRTERPEEFPLPELSGLGPLLSIVVPVYRPSLWYFRECVQSIIDQTYTNWELCLCDDGSDDAVLTATMDEYASADPRIRSLRSARSVGVSAATNRALAAASGEFIVPIDHDALLEPEALAEIVAASSVDDVDIVYSDEDRLDEFDRPHRPHFKPDWDPDLLLSYPYLGHVTAIRHDLLRSIGAFRSAFDGSQDYDIMLRASEVARRIVHIPKILYHRRVVAGPTAGDPDAERWAYAARRRVLEDAIVRRGMDAVVESAPFIGAHHLRRRIHDAPTVSIVIPFRDQAAMTVACLESLFEAPGYAIAEVVLIDNGSTEPETLVLRKRLEEREDVRVLEYPGSFNWSAVNNLAAETCASDLLLFMNNDMVASSEGWLHALVELAQLPEVGTVGARLVYPDGSLQHSGIVLGMESIAGHIFNGLPSGRAGYFGWDRTVRAYRAVTGACMMVRRSVFTEVGGFDERYPIAFNDLDFCLRLGLGGYRVLYTPHAELIHFESISRGLSGYSADYRQFLASWGDLIREDDPHYNRNLGRLGNWCGFRWPGDDEEWTATMDSLTPAGTEADGTQVIGPNRNADGRPVDSDLAVGMVEP